MTSLCLFLIVSDSDFTNNFTSIHLQLFYPNDTYNLSEPSYILYSSQTTHYNKPNHTLQQAKPHTTTRLITSHTKPLPYKQAKPTSHPTPLTTSKTSAQNKPPQAKPLPLQQANPLTQSQASPLTTSKPPHTKPSPPITTSKNLSHKSQASPLQQANPLTQSQASPPTASTPNAQKTLRKTSKSSKKSPISYSLTYF